jgi:hypothetical protein
LVSSTLMALATTRVCPLAVTDVLLAEVTTRVTPS